VNKEYIFGASILAICLLLCCGNLCAENIDPNEDDSQYAYGENVGWVNFEPQQGPGVQVSSTDVQGYIWAENIGWINLSPASYGGVVNDGSGILSGYAWGENVGWINFSPVNGGVTIDSEGNFNGWAWGENIGWIHLNSTSPVTYGVKACVVSIYDLQVFAFYWLSCGTGPADLDGDADEVDFVDYSIFAGYWQDFCPVGWQFKNITLPRDDIVFLSISDPGVSGFPSYTGEMSVFETTNTQYCKFLNDALASGDITVDINDHVIGANGSNGGADFVGLVYYDLNGAGYTYDGAVDGGAARINYSGGVFGVDARFENHPVTYVSWYGATAFCNYYGYRLPDEYEWQAVADYDGSYLYGCGASINNNIANYLGSTHPEGTAIVGSFGTYGYGMCDMAGNVGEWTNNPTINDWYIFRGGAWSHIQNYCPVYFRNHAAKENTSSDVGFRVCR